MMHLNKLLTSKKKPTILQKKSYNNEMGRFKLLCSALKDNLLLFLKNEIMPVSCTSHLQSIDFGDIHNI